MQITSFSTNKYNVPQSSKTSFSGNPALRIPVVSANVTCATVGKNKDEIRTAIGEAKKLITQLGESNSLCKGLKDVIKAAEEQLKK